MYIPYTGNFLLVLTFVKMPSEALMKLLQFLFLRQALRWKPHPQAVHVSYIVDHAHAYA